MRKGFFISFEGVEGSGKSTQVGLLSSRLKEEGRDIVVIREPGGTRIGELIRGITHDKSNVELTATSEAFLMAGARAQLVREIIRPALMDKKIVIADRYLDSSLAYQGYGRQLGQEAIWKLNKLAIDDNIPDLTFFLDVAPDVGFARQNGSKKTDRLDLQQKDFYQRVYDGYKILAEKYKERINVVNGTKPINAVAEEIWEIVKMRIK